MRRESCRRSRTSISARAARWIGRKREAMLHQIQQIMHDRVLHVPVYELAFLWGIGPRVEEACVKTARYPPASHAASLAE